MTEYSSETLKSFNADPYFQKFQLSQPYAHLCASHNIGKLQFQCNTWFKLILLLLTLKSMQCIIFIWYASVSVNLRKASSSMSNAILDCTTQIYNSGCALDWRIFHGRCVFVPPWPFVFWNLSFPVFTLYLAKSLFRNWDNSSPSCWLLPSEVVSLFFFAGYHCRRNWSQSIQGSVVIDTFGILTSVSNNHFRPNEKFEIPS